MLDLSWPGRFIESELAGRKISGIALRVSGRLALLQGAVAEGRSLPIRAALWLLVAAEPARRLQEPELLQAAQHLGGIQGPLRGELAPAIARIRDLT